MPSQVIHGVNDDHSRREWMQDISAVKTSSQPAARRLAVVGAILCLQGLPAAAQPAEAGDFRAPDLVEPSRLDATILLDIRYATADNFTGRKQYGKSGSPAPCFRSQPWCGAISAGAGDEHPLGRSRSRGGAHPAGARCR